LWVGAPGTPVVGHDEAGAVEQFNWEPDSLNYQMYVKTITQATKGVPGTPTTGGQFGAAITSVAAAPYRVDLVIAAPNTKVGSTARAGTIDIERFGDLAGHGNTPGGWYPLGWSSMTQATRGVPGTPRVGAAFGNALTAIAEGSVEDAGTHALIVGIPSAHPAGEPASGAVESFPVGPKGIVAAKGTLLRRADGPTAGDGFGAWLEGEY
jgi:hypothetical protein